MTDRDYERAERRRRTREKGRITSIVAVGVIVLALIAIIVVVIAVVGKNQPAPAPAATEAATEQPTLYIVSATTPTTAERPTAAAQPTAAPDNSGSAWSDPDASNESDESDGSDNSGEEVDTSQNSASAVAGALHYYANGSTSSGYNWTYDSMGDVSITCKYNFDEKQYDFTITGVSPGETSLTLIYYASDDQRVEVPLSVRVNDDLSVDLL